MKDLITLRRIINQWVLDQEMCADVCQIDYSMSCSFNKKIFSTHIPCHVWKYNDLMSLLYRSPEQHILRVVDKKGVVKHVRR